MADFTLSKESSLGDAIKAFRAQQNARLSERKRNLLRRLADSPDAAKAFERLKLKDRNEEIFVLQACIDADQLAVSFPSRIVEEEEMWERVNRLGKSVAALQKFVKEQSKRRLFVDGYRAVSEADGFRMVRCTLRELVVMKCGLRLVGSLIEGRRYIAETSPSKLGATRKKRETKAADIAAFRYLAAVVSRTGKPHLRAVANLAQVILNIDVSDDRVRDRRRQRQKQLR